MTIPNIDNIVEEAIYELKQNCIDQVGDRVLLIDTPTHLLEQLDFENVEWEWNPEQQRLDVKATWIHDIHELNINLDLDVKT